MNAKDLVDVVCGVISGWPAIDSLSERSTEKLCKELEVAISGAIQKSESTHQKYGCHIDLPDGEYDGCVLDGGNIDDCVYASVHGEEGRKKCGEWKPVKIVATKPKAGSATQDAQDIESLHDLAIAAAERWASAEFKNAKNLGAGGPGLPNECDDMERAARRAIAHLAAMAQGEQA